MVMVVPVALGRFPAMCGANCVSLNLNIFEEKKASVVEVRKRTNPSNSWTNPEDPPQP